MGGWRACGGGQQWPDVIEEFFAVGVGGEAVHLCDVGVEGDHVAEDGDFAPVVLDLAAQRVFGLVAGEEDGVVVVAEVMFEVVENASGFAHAGGGDDDAGAALGVEGLAGGDGADVFEVGEIKGLDEGLRFGIPEVGELAEDIGDVAGEGRIDVDGRVAGDFLRLPNLMEFIDEGLGASEGEGGHDDPAAALAVSPMMRARFVGDLGDGGMGAAAICAFGDQNVGLVEGIGVVEDGAVGPANVAGEDEGGLAAAVGGGFDDLMAAEPRMWPASRSSTV